MGRLVTVVSHVAIIVNQMEMQNSVQFSMKIHLEAVSMLKRRELKNSHCSLKKKTETEDVVHFEGRYTETVNEEGQEHPTENTETDNNQPEVITRKSLDQIVALDRISVIVSDCLNFASVAISDQDEPKNLNDAISSKNSKYWKEAGENEYQSLLKNNTWELVVRPKEKK